MSTNRGTPKEDFDRFSNFVDGMTDMEYDIWYEQEATGKQKALADSIREEVEEEESIEEVKHNENQIVKFFRRLFRQ